MLIVDNDYHMLNLLGIDHALNAVIERYKTHNFDDLFYTYSGGSLSYSNPNYPDCKFKGFYTFSGSKGFDITLDDKSYLRDSEKGFQDGCWIGLDMGHDALDVCKKYRKKWTKAEMKKLFKTSNQISLF